MMFFHYFLADESGATAVEYAVILALILIAIFSMIVLLGSTNEDVWNSNSVKISSALTS